MNVIKYLMFFFNFLFWLSGLALIIIGAIIRDKYGDYYSYADSKFTNAAVFIMIVGIVVYVIGFLGCCGAAKENYCMVTTFAFLLAVIFILEISAGVLGFAYQANVKVVATKALGKAIQGYGVETPATKLMDWAQQELECCGSDGPDDFNGKKIIVSFCDVGRGVASCHRHKKCEKGLFKLGCKSKLINFIKNNLVVIGGVAVGIASIQLLGIIFSCFLRKAIKREYEA